MSRRVATGLGPASSERGTTALEFALVLPMLIGIVGLVITAGMGATTSASLARGAEAAARAVAVPADFAAGTYASDADIVAAADEATPLVDLEAEHVTVDWHSARRGEGARFTVELAYPWDTPAAVLLTVWDTDVDAITLTATATGVRE